MFHARRPSCAPFLHLIALVACAVSLTFAGSARAAGPDTRPAAADASVKPPTPPLVPPRSSALPAVPPRGSAVTHHVLRDLDGDGLRDFGAFTPDDPAQPAGAGEVEVRSGATSEPIAAFRVDSEESLLRIAGRHPADLNDDQRIDAVDLQLLMFRLGRTTTLRGPGDLNNNRLVDEDDLTALLQALEATSWLAYVRYAPEWPPEMGNQAAPRCMVCCIQLDNGDLICGGAGAGGGGPGGVGVGGGEGGGVSGGGGGNTGNGNGNNPGGGSGPSGPVCQIVVSIAVPEGSAIVANTWDHDGDGIEGFADGFDWNPLVSEDNEDDTPLTPVLVQVAGAMPNARYRISYIGASDPADLGLTIHSGWVIPPGRVRLWRTSNARDMRPADEGGDYLPPGIYSAQQLGLSGPSGLLYLEAVRESETPNDIVIRIEVDPTGYSGFICSSSDGATAARVELRAWNLGESTFHPAIALIATNLYDATSPPPPGMTEGAWQTYRIQIHDPRSLEGQMFRLSEQTLMLTECEINTYTTPEFFVGVLPFPPNTAGLPGCYPIVLDELESVVEWEYDAGGSADSPRRTKGKVERVILRSLDKNEQVVANVIMAVIDEMQAENWQPTGPPNTGAFGNEVHRRVFDRMTGNGWYSSVWVHRNTREIMSIGSPAGVLDTIEIDLLRVRNGVQLNVGDTFDPNQLRCRAFEIKTSVSGAVRTFQRDRLTELLGNRGWCCATPPRRWTPTAWVPHQYGGKLIRLGGVLGIASSVYMILQAPDCYEYLDVMLVAYEQAMRPELDDFERHLAVVGFISEFNTYLAVLTGDASRAGILSVAMFYQYLSLLE